MAATAAELALVTGQAEAEPTASGAATSRGAAAATATHSEAVRKDSTGRVLVAAVAAGRPAGDLVEVEEDSAAAAAAAADVAVSLTDGVAEIIRSKQ